MPCRFLLGSSLVRVVVSICFLIFRHALGVKELSFGATHFLCRKFGLDDVELQLASPLEETTNNFDNRGQNLKRPWLSGEITYRCETLSDVRPPKNLALEKGSGTLKAEVSIESRGKNARPECNAVLRNKKKHGSRDLNSRSRRRTRRPEALKWEPPPPPVMRWAMSGESH